MLAILEGDLLIVEAGPPGGEVHAAAMVFELTHDGNRFWADVNFGGSHLPQWYWTKEVKGRLQVNDQADYHGFCRDCLGWGLSRGGTIVCPACGGSGRTSMYVVIETSPNVTEALAEIDLAKANAIPCEVCRKRLLLGS